MQNKPNCRNDKMNINLDMTSIYKDFANRSHEKTNPIQTQFKPKQTQYKANSNPISERAKLNAFAWIKSLVIILEMLLADSTTLKGANSNPMTTAISAPATLMIDDCIHPAYNDNVHF